MDYAQAKEIRSKGFSSRLTEKLLSGQGVGLSLIPREAFASIRDFDFERVFDFSGITKRMDELKDSFNIQNLLNEMNVYEFQPGVPGVGPTESTQYDELFQRIGQQEGVDPALLKSIAKAESRFNVKAVSEKGAGGLMQLMPGTAARFGVKDVFEPEQNVRGGAKYLKYLTKLFHGDMDKVIAAYNAGEGNVMKYGGTPPFQETQQYVAKVKGYYTGSPIPKPMTTQVSSTEYFPPTENQRATSGIGEPRFRHGAFHHRHEGVDYAAKVPGQKGDPIHAVHSGVVEKVQRSEHAGLYVWLKGDDGTQSRYLHLNSTTVKPGDRIEKGQVIAQMGDSGSPGQVHLHFELRDQQGNIINPETVFSRLAQDTNTNMAGVPDQLKKTKQGGNIILMSQIDNNILNVNVREYIQTTPNTGHLEPTKRIFGP